MSVKRFVDNALKGIVKQVLFGPFSHPDQVGAPQGGSFTVPEVDEIRHLSSRGIGQDKKPVEVINGTPVTVKMTGGKGIPQGPQVGSTAAKGPSGPGVGCRPVSAEEMFESRQVRVEEGAGDMATSPQVACDPRDPCRRLAGFYDGRVNEQNHVGGILNRKASGPCFSLRETGASCR